MVTTAQTEYILTDDEKGMVVPMIETIENLQKEVQSVLRAITRLRKLDGNYTLQGDRLVLVPPATANNGNG